MKIMFICVGIICLVSLITYLIGTILEYRRKKIIDEMNKALEHLEDFKNEDQ